MRRDIKQIIIRIIVTVIGGVFVTLLTGNEKCNIKIIQNNNYYINLTEDRELQFQNMKNDLL